MKQKLIAIIDGHNMAYRAFYQPRYKTMKRSDGKKSGTFFGFFTILHNVIRQFKPDELIIVFDGDFSSRIKEGEYSGYKAGRKKRKKNFTRQLYDIRECLLACGIRVLSIPGVEADDILFHIAKWIESSKNRCLIVSADTDMLQAVTHQTYMHDGYQQRLWTPKLVKKRYKIAPKYIPIYKAIVGDKTDNIKGVYKHGPASAVKFIKKLKKNKGDLPYTCTRFFNKEEHNDFVRALQVITIHPNQHVIAYVNRYVRLKGRENKSVVKKWLRLYSCNSFLVKLPEWLKVFKEVA